MASDAMAGRLLLMLKDGEAIPVASPQTDIQPDDKTGFVSMVYADLSAFSEEQNDTLFEMTLTIPSWLNQAAKRKNIDFSTTLHDALIAQLAQ